MAEQHWLLKNLDRWDASQKRGCCATMRNFIYVYGHPHEGERCPWCNSKAPKDT
jgi:hypothetical protein